MRLAEADDAIRRITEKAGDWPFRIGLLEYTGYSALGTGDLPIALPVTVLCGYCGAGKSTLLQLLWAVLDPAAASLNIGTRRKLGTGKARLTFTEEATSKSIELNWADESFSGPGIGREVVYVDSGEILALTREHFPADSDIEATLEGTSAFMLEDKELDRVDYLMRRDYDGIEVFEVEFSDVVVPFFRASYGSVAYDSRTMGSGELSVLYLWWVLKRASNGAIILVEEPESFASAASQRGLVEHMAQVALQKRLTVIATSHSPSVLLRLPGDSARFLVRDKKGVRYEPKPRPELQARLGIFPDRELTIYVEDDVAACFAREWLSVFNNGLLTNVSIEKAAGVSDVVGRLAVLPRDLPRQRFLGLLDGDARDEKLGNAADVICFLPSKLAPELLLKQAAELNIGPLADEFGLDFGQVLEAAEGLNLHDWLVHVVKATGTSKQRVVEVLFRAWLTDTTNEELARQAATELTEIASKIMA